MIYSILSTTLYKGRRCHLLELTSQHIRELYPLSEVKGALRAYRPWYKPDEHPIDNLVQRNEWLASLSPRPEIEALIVCAHKLKPVGFICLGGIDSNNLKAELSIGMFHHQGSRITFEALHWVLETAFANLFKVVFCVSPANTQAIRLLKSLDIQVEAVLKQEVLGSNGARQDLLRYALLAPEWSGSNTRKLLRRVAPLGPATLPHSP